MSSFLLTNLYPPKVVSLRDLYHFSVGRRGKVPEVGPKGATLTPKRGLTPFLLLLFCDSCSIILLVKHLEDGEQVYEKDKKLQRISGLPHYGEYRMDDKIYLRGEP